MCTSVIGTPCVIPGTVTLIGGVLTLLTPTALIWGGTVSGSAQSVVDATATDTGYEVSDLTGSSDGWNVSASATTFTNALAPAGTAATFPDAGTLVSAGSTPSVSATTVPSATCIVSCTLPTGGEPTYPLGITTAASTPTPV